MPWKGITLHVFGIGSVITVPTASEEALLEAQLLVTHLQGTAETDKASLARLLHDELGALMVSALMDLGAIQQLQADLGESVRLRLERAKESLRAAIDLKRRVIEGLRPSLLDDLGLFSALRSHLTRLRENSNIDWAAHYPDIEPELEPDASLALYRIAEEALAMTLKRGSVTSTALHVEVIDGTLRMSVSDDGTPSIVSDGHEAGATTALASMRHRLGVLGGKVDLRRNDAGGTVLTASIPLGSHSGR
jgi:signal transduction histidine kinase